MYEIGDTSIKVKIHFSKNEVNMFKKMVFQCDLELAQLLCVQICCYFELKNYMKIIFLSFPYSSLQNKFH